MPSPQERCCWNPNRWGRKWAFVAQERTQARGLRSDPRGPSSPGAPARSSQRGSSEGRGGASSPISLMRNGGPGLRGSRLPLAGAGVASHPAPTAASVCSCGLTARTPNLAALGVMVPLPLLTRGWGRVLGQRAEGCREGFPSATGPQLMPQPWKRADHLGPCRRGPSVTELSDVCHQVTRLTNFSFSWFLPVCQL